MEGQRRRSRERRSQIGRKGKWVCKSLCRTWDGDNVYSDVNGTWKSNEAQSKLLGCRRAWFAVCGEMDAKDRRGRREGTRRRRRHCGNAWPRLIAGVPGPLGPRDLLSKRKATPKDRGAGPGSDPGTFLRHMTRHQHRHILSAHSATVPVLIGQWACFRSSYSHSDVEMEGIIRNLRALQSMYLTTAYHQVEALHR